MKKLILLAFFFCLTSCAGQEPVFEKAEYHPPAIITIVGIAARNDNGTLSFAVDYGERQRIFLTDASHDVVEGWEYKVSLKIAFPEQLKGRYVVRGTLLDHSITPEQARINCERVSNFGNDNL